MIDLPSRTKQISNFLIVDFDVRNLYFVTDILVVILIGKDKDRLNYKIMIRPCLYPVDTNVIQSPMLPFYQGLDSGRHTFVGSLSI
jgi:hypothetical protein